MAHLRRWKNGRNRKQILLKTRPKFLNYSFFYNSILKSNYILIVMEIISGNTINKAVVVKFLKNRIKIKYSSEIWMTNYLKIKVIAAYMTHGSAVK